MRAYSAILITLVVASFAIPSASAHASKTSDDGKVKITWGLLDEPGFTYQKNKLDLIIRDNATNAGIGGLTAANFTEIALHYGEEEYALGNVTAYRGAKGANAGDGNYTAANAVFLTRPGIYTLHVKGNIQGSEIDVEIPAAHEYEDMSEIMFPEEIEFGADTSALEARIAVLETEIAALKAQAKTQSETPATVTEQPTSTVPVPGFGLLAAALGAVGVALVLRRKA